MSLVGLAVISVLFAAGTYLVMQRILSRVIIGLALVSHGAHLLIISSGGDPGEPPVLADGTVAAAVADPLPQAMVLTAIVIAFGVTAFLLALALRSFVLTGSDEVEDDIEDRRIARTTRQPEEPVHDIGLHEEGP